jgi:hypothetical protein
MDTADLNRAEPTTAPAATGEYTEAHRENLGTLLSLAEKQYEVRLQATDGLDSKLGLVLAALAGLLVATTSLVWSPRWYQIALGVGWLLTLLAACACALAGLGPRGYESTDVRKFRAKYFGKSPAAFADQLLTEYTDHIEANTGFNARKARLFTWALRLGAVALFFYALEVAIEKHV